MIINVPHDRRTIQAALDALPPTGGVVTVDPGMYVENLSCLKPFTLCGLGQIGPNWVTGQNPTVFIQARSGTVLDIGTPLNILDPGCVIQGVAIGNMSGCHCDYGIRIRRSRNVTLRDVQFSNFQPTGTALYLDGESGFVEWARLDNIWFSNCFTPITAINATDLNIQGGGIMNVTCWPGSVGIKLVDCDTPRVFGWAALEVENAINLGYVNAPWSMAAIYGLRVECHTGTTAKTGVLVYTNNNLIHGASFYGITNGVKMLSGTTGNKVRDCSYLAMTGDNVVDLGQGNSVS